MEVVAVRNYAVLQCVEDSEYVKNMYGGYIGVYMGILGEEGEKWVSYMVANGEFPKDEDEIESFDGFVITGSCDDADGDDDWICKLVDLLKKLDSLKKKVLGICFGHQVLARALGGKIGRSNSGWDIGVTPIHFSSPKLISSLKMTGALSLIECHQDEVTELPPNVEVIAWSSKTSIEVFKFGDHIMGIQGHPEYTIDILLYLIGKLLRLGYISESFANEMKVKLDEQEPDREVWKKLCTNFLKGRL